MITRFQGTEGERLLNAALTTQLLISGSEEIALRISEAGNLVTFTRGEALIRANDIDNQVFFIVSGSVEILVNSRAVAIRVATMHVGEMALIDPSAARCATVVAKEEIVAVALDEPHFTEIANDHPSLWRRISLELGERLRQRNRLVFPPNEKPHLFIGCSVESLAVARAIQLGLEHDAVSSKVWTDQVFGPSSMTIQALEVEVETADFGAMILAPDDEILYRDGNVSVPRDNVVFELGMCIGKLGHGRSFIIHPRGIDLQIPTDLLGITPITYQIPTGGDWDAAMAAACELIRRKIKILGAI